MLADRRRNADGVDIRCPWCLVLPMLACLSHERILPALAQSSHIVLDEKELRTLRSKNAKRSVGALGA